MSMTAPGCGMGDALKADACRKVQGVAGVTDVDIEIVWEPAWDIHNLPNVRILTYRSQQLISRSTSSLLLTTGQAGLGSLGHAAPVSASGCASQT
jgi:hypothetical protein